jgi:dTDP-4-dehydrorhamnose reductase
MWYMHFKVLVTGTTSIHGYPVFSYLNKNPSYSLMGIRSPKMRLPSDDSIIPLCITDREGLRAIQCQFAPTHVVHCAGVCDLDVCEERPAWAEAMNTDGARAVTEIFGQTAHLIYMSSDLVFSGNNPPDGGYTEEHWPDPLSVAGRTIHNAELEFQKASRHTIVRLGLPIGVSVTGDKGAVDFIDYRLRRSLPLTLFHDEWRSCIACEDIACSTEKIILQSICGVYHLGGPVPVSLYEIGQWVLRNGGYDSKFLNSLSRFEEKNGPPRIGNVALNSSKLLSRLGIELQCPVTGMMEDR